eukprot:10228351-Heterocapsa_arctica.AAC.1
MDQLSDPSESSFDGSSSSGMSTSYSPRGTKRDRSDADSMNPAGNVYQRIGSSDGASETTTSVRTESPTISLTSPHGGHPDEVMENQEEEDWWSTVYWQSEPPDAEHM